tara:strand:- start:26187 stop:26444 length:258 start_codon:yes stop_codon:yes gene_type:complete
MVITGKKGETIVSEILKADGTPYQYLVCWKGMLKGSEEPLPLRPFPTKELADTYILGCADVICINSRNELDVADVVRDFIITEAS